MLLFISLILHTHLFKYFFNIYLFLFFCFIRFLSSFFVFLFLLFILLFLVFSFIILCLHFSFSLIVLLFYFIVIIILILKSSKHIFLYFWLNGLLLLLDILILFFVCIFLQFFLFEKKLRFAVAHQINQRIDILIIIITNIKAILKSFEFHPVVPDLFANHPSRLILMSSHPFMTLDFLQVNSLLRISI